MIKDAPKYGGGVNKEVLIQEYLMGEEYAVDTVSATGTHKVTALWKYDKRAVNGAPCVYFATILQGAGEEEEEAEGRRVCDYVLKEVLPALGVEWGPTHTEVRKEEREGGREEEEDVLVDGQSIPSVFQTFVCDPSSSFSLISLFR